MHSPADPPEPEGTVVPPEVVDAEPIEDRPPRPQGHGSSRLSVGYEESRYVSPLPAPADLERYAALLPDAPERLLAAGEREQAHRHEIEGRLAKIDEEGMPRFYAGQKRAHTISVVVAVIYLGIMLAAILKGQAIVGGSGAALGLATVIWAIRRDPSSGNQTPPPSPGDELAAPVPEDEAPD